MYAFVKGFFAAGLALSFGAGAALAADLPTRKGPAPYVAPEPTINWTGFYLGVNGGYGGDSFRYPFSLNYSDAGAPAPATTAEAPLAVAPTTNESLNGTARINSSGFLGGIQAGFNYQFGSSFVGGVEGDADLAAIKGMLHLDASTSSSSTFPGSAAASIGSQTDYVDTLRLRLGYLATPQWLLYGTGGLAVGNVKSSVSANADIPDVGLVGGFSASKESWRTGWTLGAGSEFKITRNLSFKAEYLYVDLGSSTVLSGSGAKLLSATDSYGYNLKVRTTDNIVRAGLNWSFN